MRVAFVTTCVAGLALCTGCSSSAERRLEGRWLGDTITNVEAAQLASAIGWVRGASFEFAGSNLTVAVPTELPRTGEYEVVQSGDRDVIIAVRRPEGAVDTAQLSFESDHVLRWHIGEGRDIVMRRMD